ncbi:MAG: hypothetical protein J7L11_01540 [Thermoprotei archaeon]|nr:hypothetical protein [Thermoprotei archaeon]
MSIVIISANECARAFELVGARCVIATDQSEAEMAFMEAITMHPTIIVLDEDVAEMVSELQHKLFKDLKEPPMIAIIPSFTKARGTRLSQLYDMISRAVGVRLRWQS